MTTIDALRNRFKSLVQSIEAIDEVKRVPFTIIEYVNNIHDEFAEYDAMVLDNTADPDTHTGIQDQIKYIDEILNELEYKFDKLCNKKE